MRLSPKLISKTVTNTQKLNARRCKEQLKQLNRFSNLLPCTHQIDTRIRAKHFATKTVQFLQSFFAFDPSSCSSSGHWRNLSLILQKAAKKKSMGSDLELAKPTGAPSWDETAPRQLSTEECWSTHCGREAALRQGGEQHSCLFSSTWIKLKQTKRFLSHHLSTVLYSDSRSWIISYALLFFRVALYDSKSLNFVYPLLPQQYVYENCSHYWQSSCTFNSLDIEATTVACCVRYNYVHR